MSLEQSRNKGVRSLQAATLIWNDSVGRRNLVNGKDAQSMMNLIGDG
jgi:hypothetical protein